MKGRREDWKKSGIYSIICKINGKQYIGQTNNIYRRINMHKCRLNQQNKKSENIYILSDWLKYGEDNFDYNVLEYSNIDLKEKENNYIIKLNTLDRNTGYNLRRDTKEKGMIPLEETRKRYSEAMIKRFSRIEEREKQSEISKRFWKENPEKKEIMKKKVSNSITKYKFYQYSKSKELIKIWDSIFDIICENPTYKRHNIYAVCSGEKPSIYGYIWSKIPN